MPEDQKEPLETKDIQTRENIGAPSSLGVGGGGFPPKTKVEKGGTVGTSNDKSEDDSA